MPGVTSLQRHLLLWLLAALSAGAAVLVVVSYLVTLDEMDEIFDDNLQEAALVLAMHHRFDVPGQPLPRSALPALPARYEAEGRFDFATLAWTRDGHLLHVSDPEAPRQFAAENGLMHLKRGDEEWHVYTVVVDAGVVQTAQRESSRTALAAEAASKLFPPLALLILLTAGLLVVALRRGLRPLGWAAQEASARQAASAEPIRLELLPREIHPFARAINALLGRLAEAFDTQRRFVADAAHELRSPITALRLQLQLLERAGDDDARTKAVAELRAGIARSQRLIEQLLSLSRVGADTPVVRGPVSLRALVHDVVSQRSAEAEHAGVDLGADVAPAVPPVQGDAQQLYTLLDNLVGNAVRYTPRGGRIDVRARLIDGHPALQVTDTGPGIPAAERARVFDRFYRGADLGPHQRANGSGLGLAIVKAVADQHGARVDLLDAPGGGLDVRVVFHG